MHVRCTMCEVSRSAVGCRSGWMAAAFVVVAGALITAACNLVICPVDAVTVLLDYLRLPSSFWMNYLPPSSPLSLCFYIISSSPAD